MSGCTERLRKLDHIDERIAGAGSISTGLLSCNLGAELLVEDLVIGEEEAEVLGEVAHRGSFGF